MRRRLFGSRRGRGRMTPVMLGSSKKPAAPAPSAGDALLLEGTSDAILLEGTADQLLLEAS